MPALARTEEKTISDDEGQDPPGGERLPGRVGRRGVVLGMAGVAAALAIAPSFTRADLAVAATAITYTWPFANVVLPDRRYGQQWDAYRPDGRKHAGADFNVGVAYRGTPVLSIADGTVVRGRYTAEASGTQTYTFGNFVTIRNGDGIYATYAHMDGAPLVNPGDRVSRGQTVGRLGSTGTNVFHLHLEMRTGDHAGDFTTQDDFDPVPFIQARLDVPIPPAIEDLPERQEMYLTRNSTGEVAVFGADYRNVAGGASGRHSFTSFQEYQDWRELVRFYNQQIDVQGLDTRGKLFLPPADITKITGVTEANWAVVNSVHGS
ncbi:M23 family metallopeptidase [Clavibacter michiganensis subsp. tessellarius]|uniref:M23 family metallopeptidase n=3 Tax=Microbacteriaceae TaxID=85023 RepID=UPI003626F6CC